MEEARKEAPDLHLGKWGLSCPWPVGGGLLVTPVRLWPSRVTACDLDVSQSYGCALCPRDPRGWQWMDGVLRCQRPGSYNRSCPGKGPPDRCAAGVSRRGVGQARKVRNMLNVNDVMSTLLMSSVLTAPMLQWGTWASGRGWAALRLTASSLPEARLQSTTSSVCCRPGEWGQGWACGWREVWILPAAEGVLTGQDTALW